MTSLTPPAAQSFEAWFESQTVTRLSQLLLLDNRELAMWWYEHDKATWNARGALDAGIVDTALAKNNRGKAIDDLCMSLIDKIREVNT